MLLQGLCNIYAFHPSLHPPPTHAPPPQLPLQPIIHQMLMNRCRLHCPSDIMPVDGPIDPARSIWAEMMQQHYMIYSGFNILRQGVPPGPGSPGLVFFHHLKYQNLFTEYNFSFSWESGSDSLHLAGSLTV